MSWRIFEYSAWFMLSCDFLLMLGVTRSNLGMSFFFAPILDTANIGLPLLGPLLYSGSQALPLLHT
ncbi:hypothetical protein C8J57DRAFT_1280856, partial [Mycena rebaudengoi]